MKTRITTIFLVAAFSIALALPAMAATKPSTKFDLGTPKAGTATAQLQATLQFNNDLITRLQAMTTSHEGTVNEGIAKNVYDQASAGAINKRDKGVNSKVAKVLKQFSADLTKLIAKKSVKKRKASIPASPFGKAISSVPSAKMKDKLLALQKQLGQMDAYDSSAIIAIDLLLASTTAPNALQKSLSASLKKAYNNDKSQIGKTNAQINNNRFSTAGITAWKASEVAAIADNKTRTGTTLEIQEGFETGLRSKVQLDGTNKFLVNFQEVVGWAAQENTASDPYVITDCNATGTGSASSGITFKGTMGDAYCGSANVKVDTKGRISGEVNSFPPPIHTGGWSLSKILVDGLVNKDGTAQFNSVTIPNPGSEFAIPLYNEGAFN